MQRACRHSNNWNHFNANWQSTGTTWIIKQLVEQSCPYVVWLWNDFTCLFLSLWSPRFLWRRVTGSQSLTASWDLFFKRRYNLKPNRNGWEIDRFNYGDVETIQEAFTGNMEVVLRSYLSSHVGSRWNNSALLSQSFSYSGISRYQGQNAHEIKSQAQEDLRQSEMYTGKKKKKD